MKTNCPLTFKYIIFSNVCSVLSGIKVSENKTGQKLNPVSTQSKTRFSLMHLARRLPNFRQQKMFRQHLLTLKTLEMTPVWINDHQLR